MTTKPANPADPIFQVKQMQKEAWKRFAPLEAITTSTAGLLVRFAESSLECESSMPAVAPE